MGFGLGVTAPRPEMIAAVQPGVAGIRYIGRGVVVIMIRANQQKSSSDSTPLAAELAAYKHESARLEASHMGKWVVFRGSACIAIYDSFDHAAADAVGRFGRGPYLIRQIGAPPIVIPASIAYPSVDEDQT